MTFLARQILDVTGGKPIAVWSQSISDLQYSHAVNPLVAFYDIIGRKVQVLFLFSVPDTTQDNLFYGRYLAIDT
jgi:hypothetical protein